MNLDIDFFISGTNKNCIGIFVSFFSNVRKTNCIGSNASKYLHGFIEPFLLFVVSFNITIIIYYMSALLYISVFTIIVNFV